MPTPEMTALIEHFVNDYLNTGNEEVGREIFSPQMVNHHGKQGSDRAAFMQAIATARKAVPDLNFACERIIQEGDAQEGMVALMMRMRGTHTGQYGNVPASGNSLDIPFITIFRFKGGQVMDRWNEIDYAEWARQIGGAPPNQPAKATA